ncbi:hypothetical protein [Streptomyces sp. 3213.3]|uniref:hypothetical protein n=1 Tax=Streptomyces sp. 3213.3 TaxID=1855348 RepID=UPI000B028160
MGTDPRGQGRDLGGRAAAAGVRVVTAAALIMFTVVRMTLVPAVLVLSGRGAWWLPGRLDRILPDLDAEGSSLRKAEPAERAEPDPVVAGGAGGNSGP